VPGGRSLDPHLFDTTSLGELRSALRPDKRLPFTMQEYEQWVAFTRFPWEELQARADRGIVSRGAAVVAPLLKSAAELGVTFVTEAAVDRLVDDRGAVVGVRVGDVEFPANDAVVLASGGFEWNDQMVKEFLGGPILAKCSPPYNTGDSIRMATRLGAKLGNMREAWWAPMTIIPGDTVDGEQVGTLLRFERQGPGSIIVDKHGRRFVNESQNYNDMTRAFHAVDPVNHNFAHLPAYVIIDEEYLELYGLLSHRAGAELPSWLTAAPTLDELGAALGFAEGVLPAEVERFNGFARTGDDIDFTRGDNAYDRYWGDDQRPFPNPSLAPIDRAPFYAMEIVPGAFGTNGGLVTDDHARVLNAEETPIPGLYAAGNTTAHPMGGGYAGAGATLGPGMTMGYIAGRTIAESASSDLASTVADVA
jgi:3-oxosteroid 1-dehydrogenase